MPEHRHDHSWRIEGDDEYEPFHNVCEDCGTAEYSALAVDVAESLRAARLAKAEALLRRWSTDDGQIAVETDAFSGPGPGVGGDGGTVEPEDRRTEWETPMRDQFLADGLEIANLRGDLEEARARLAGAEALLREARDPVLPTPLIEFVDALLDDWQDDEELIWQDRGTVAFVAGLLLGAEDDDSDA